MSPDDEDLPSIETTSLETVTGGTASNDDVTSAVTALSNDLKDFLKNQKSGSSDFLNQMLPFLLMMSGGNWNFSGGGFSCSGGGGCCGRCGCSPCRCRR